MSSISSELTNIYSRTATMLSLFVALVTIAAMALFFIEEDVSGSTALVGLRSAEISERLDGLESEVAGLRGLPPRETISLGEVELERLENVEARQKLIEEALGQDIERAMSVAILRKELELISVQSDQRMSSIENRLESLFNLLLWIGGAMLTVLLGLVGLVAARKSEENGQDGSKKPVPARPKAASA